MTEPAVHDDGSGERGILRSSALVGLGTSVSRLTGFARVAAIAYALGGAALAGTYSYASQTPAMLYELLLGGVLTATLVPIFVRLHEEHDEDGANAIVTVSAIALIALAVVGVIFAPVFVRLFTFRVDGAERAAQQEVATALLRLFMPMLFFFGTTALATAMLHARRRFAAAAFAPVLNNVVVIATFLAASRLFDGELTLDQARDDTALLLLLGLGTTAGIASVTIALYPAVRHAGIRLRFLPSWRHRAVALMARLSGWTVGYVIANQVAQWFVLVLANGVDGGPFIYISAYVFFQLPHGLLAVSLTTTLAPEMASAASRADLAALRERLSFGIRVISVLILPAAAAYIGLARPIVVALLQRGAFTAEDSALLADTIVGFSIGLVFFSIYLFTLRAYYALPDTRTPFLLNGFENGVNIALAIPLYLWLGIPGLAAAFSLAYVAASVVTLLALRRRLGPLGGRALTSSFLRAGAAAALVAAVTWASSSIIGWETPTAAIAATVVGVLAGTAVYVAGLAVLRAPELTALWSMLPGRTRRASV